MKKNFLVHLVQVLFSLVGAGMLIAGYFAAPGSLTDDGYPLRYFFYGMGAFFIIWPMILSGLIRFFYRRPAERIAYLKQYGIKGKARVLHMRRTGVSINRVPQMILDLSITTGPGEQLQVSYKKCIEPFYYSLIRPDKDLTVYVDPAGRRKVCLDLEEAWSDLAGKDGSGF